MLLSEIIDQLESLALQLEKLLKVINHSDPTAATKKVILYKKYQENLKNLVSSVKPFYSWQELQNAFKNSKVGSKIEVSNQKVVLKKIEKDLEVYFIEAHVLTEFDAPVKARKRKKLIKKAPLKKRPVAPEKDNHKHYTKENIMEMVLSTKKQIAARSRLKNAISKIKQLNPDRLETKINEYLLKVKK